MKRRRTLSVHGRDGMRVEVIETRDPEPTVIHRFACDRCGAVVDGLSRVDADDLLLIHRC